MSSLARAPREPPKQHNFSHSAPRSAARNRHWPRTSGKLDGAVPTMKRMIAAIGLTLALLAPASAGSRGPQRTVVDSIIVHAISGPYCASGEIAFSGAPGSAERWKDFFDRHPFLGIHYVVGRDGEVLASTPELRVANHAYANNATTIGIELVHDGNGVEPFADPQIEALIRLLKSIRGRHAIPIENIKGHSDVDARTFNCGGRHFKTKVDPGANFPWGRVRAELRADPPRLVAGPKPAVRPRPAARAPTPRH
jgi:N-acetylmuramoyl-L-alanine amidase